MNTHDHQGRGLAMSAGHVTVAMRAELGRLLAASRGDRRKALAAGLTELHNRKILHAKEATELAAIMEMFFDAPDGQDPKLAKRASTYFHTLSLDFDQRQHPHRRLCRDRGMIWFDRMIRTLGAGKSGA